MESSLRRMSFTVATISFNQGRFLQTCLDSVQLQRQHAEVQYVVVDGGSRDGSVEIAKGATGVDVLLTGPDGGPADGLNRALDVAIGEYFFFINADDFILPDAFNFTVAQQAILSSADLALGDAYLVDESGAVVRPFRSPATFNIKGYRRQHFVLPQQGMIVRTKALRRIGGFNTNNRTCWDTEMVVRLASDGASIVHLNRALGAYRVQPDSISVSGDRDRQLREDLLRLRSAPNSRMSQVADRIGKVGHLLKSRTRTLELLTYGRMSRSVRGGRGPSATKARR